MPLSRPVLVPAGLPHLALLSRLHGLCFDEGWSERTFAELLALPGSFALLAMAEDGDPIGFVLARLALDEGEILSLGVVPTDRRDGVGRRLLAGAVQRVAALGATKLFLEVAESNLAAQALYAGAGFHPVGRRPGYYRTAGGNAEAALVLRRDLEA